MTYFVSDWPSDWPRASDWPGANRSGARRLRRGGGARKWHDLAGPVSRENVARNPTGIIPMTSATLEAKDFEGQLRAICREYASGLPGKVRALAAVLDRREGGLPVLAEARELAHRLTRTAGTYGFIQISELASHLERHLSHLVDERESGAILVLAEIEQVLEKLRAAAEQEANGAAVG